MTDTDIATIDDLTKYGGVDPRAVLGYAWDLIDGPVGQDWLKEFADLRDHQKHTDVFCDSCGALVHMGHDEPDGVWLRIDTHAVCANCIIENTIGADP